ncbi:MAG TPA: PrsW family glutamic-type intramembrane protease [Flavisolibacter sp.]|nr:PrsW family glutamic-type intramembrane protease [Flavisolibacter sp.]
METAVDLSTIVLECIDGKDDHFSTEIAGHATIILAGAAAEGSVFIKELQYEGGVILVTNTGGRLLIDATDCAVPVKINGSIIARSVLHPNDVLRIGKSIWKTVLPAEEINPEPEPSSMRDHFTNFIGLEELRDLRLKDIFSQVFKKHTLVQMEDQLVTGTISSTPGLTDIETTWARPWLFSRMLVVSVAISILMIIGFRTFENPNLIPGLIFIGSFAVPVSTLIFFLELNAPRNISIFMVMALAFLGGVMALFVALIFFDRLGFLSDLLSASAAGIIEEAAKLFAVVLIVGRYARYRWILNGLLFGAAVGMGFAAFESAGYAYRSSGSFEAMVDNIVIRGLLSPFMHIVWTANAAAALWLVKGERSFEWSMLSDARFLRVLLSSVLLHMIWNADFSILPVPVVLDIKYPLLGILAWAICFRLVQAGLKQLNKARRLEIERLSAT